MRMMNNIKSQLFLFLGVGVVLNSIINLSQVLAHGGRTNARVCHDNKNYEYYLCDGYTAYKKPTDKLTSKDRYEKVVIDSCYDGDTCTTTSGEKIRLACIDTPEIRGSKADPIPAIEARDFLNNLVAGNQVDIRRITIDRFGRTVAELSKDGVNFQELMVAKNFARIYKNYAAPCSWAK